MGLDVVINVWTVHFGQREYGYGYGYGMGLGMGLGMEKRFGQCGLKNALDSVGW